MRLRRAFRSPGAGRLDLSSGTGFFFLLPGFGMRVPRTGTVASSAREKVVEKAAIEPGVMVYEEVMEAAWPAMVGGVRSGARARQR